MEDWAEDRDLAPLPETNSRLIVRTLSTDHHPIRKSKSRQLALTADG
jgi:hypothetical protein